MSAVRTRRVRIVVPAGIDDPDRPSGGNRYDRRLVQGLTGRGWAVQERAVAGSWPDPSPDQRADLAGVLARIGDGETVLVDGLLATGVPEVLVPAAGRLRVVVVVHLPLGVPDPAARSGERAVLAAAAAVVATSDWTARWLRAQYGCPRIAVAEPGVEAAGLGTASASGGRLLCVGPVTRAKGADLLPAALTGLTDLAWDCRWVGPLGPEGLDLAWAAQAALGTRLRFTGPLAEADLARTYAEADLLVAPTRYETYGMVITEALARGLPVVASAVGGVPAALGRTASGAVPGMLVPPGDVDSLRAALRDWLLDPVLRSRLRGAARERRHGLHDWTRTAAAVGTVLEEVSR